jgi:hypothetical protein
MKTFFLLVFTSIIFSFNIKAQNNSSNSCKNFTQTGVDILNENDYIPDGRFNTTKVAADDRIEIYKPFYRGRNYMIVITIEDDMPGVYVEVKDITRKVILKNDKAKKQVKFEFVPEKNQNLIISVKVDKNTETENTETNGKKGCIAVLVGYKI